MQYLLLIYGDEKIWETMSEDDQRAIVGGYFAYSDIQIAALYGEPPVLHRPRSSS